MTGEDMAKRQPPPQTHFDRQATTLAGDRHQGPERGGASTEAVVSVASFLGLVVIAELITADWIGPLGLSPQAAARTGALVHVAASLVALLLGTRLVQKGLVAAGRLLSAAALAPFIRILSLVVAPRTQDLASFGGWLLFLGIPLLFALFLVIRGHGLSASDVGLRPSAKAWWFNGLVIVASVGFGFLEYLALRPAAAHDHAAATSIVLAIAGILVTTSIFEELLFRGILQRYAVVAFPPQAGIIIVTLLFTALHIGNRSAADLVIVFLVGWLYAQAVARSGTLWGVIVGHAVTNIVLFVVAPAVLP